MNTDEHGFFAEETFQVSETWKVRSLRFVLTFLCALILVGCAWQPVTEPRRFDPAGEPTPLPALEIVEKPTYVVERGRVAEEVVFTGRVGSVVEVSIESDQDGIISAVLVHDGAAIVTGDTLALLDTRDLDEALELTRGELATVEAQIALLADDMATNLEIATLTLEQARLQLQAAEERGADETELAILRLEVDIAQLALNNVSNAIDPELGATRLELEQQIKVLETEQMGRRLLSPADGDLLSLSLSGGARLRIGTVVGTLVDLDQLVIWAQANEGELALLEEGMTVSLALPDNPEEPFVGSIERLPFPHGNGTIRPNSMQIATENLPEYGHRVDVTITLREETEALWLPPAALREFAGQSFVIVQEGDSERRVDVEVGIVSPGRVEIVEGLEEGMVVVVP